MLQGHEVIVADNFFTGRKRNIEHWIGHENFELINHDIVNPLYIEGSSSSLILFLHLSHFSLNSRSDLSSGFTSFTTCTVNRNGIAEYRNTVYFKIDGHG